MGERGNFRSDSIDATTPLGIDNSVFSLPIDIYAKIIK